jgi:hypothetical protein
MRAYALCTSGDLVVLCVFRQFILRASTHQAATDTIGSTQAPNYDAAICAVLRYCQLSQCKLEVDDGECAGYKQFFKRMHCIHQPAAPSCVFMTGKK